MSYNDFLPFGPTEIMAHLKPIVAVDESWSRDLLVPGDNQYAISFHEPPL